MSGPRRRKFAGPIARALRGKAVEGAVPPQMGPYHRSRHDEEMTMAFSYQRRYRGPIQAVLLDWAGTTMDYGCMAPAVVFVEVTASPT